MLFVAPPDAETQWREFEALVRSEAGFFDATGPIAGARAPGRLDVMGGVADYSGSIVLEMPLAEAACVAWQWREDRLLRIRTVGAESAGLEPEVTLALDDLIDSENRMRPIDEVHRHLTAEPSTRCARPTSPRCLSFSSSTVKFALKRECAVPLMKFGNSSSVRLVLITVGSPAWSLLLIRSLSATVIHGRIMCCSQPPTLVDRSTYPPAGNILIPARVSWKYRKNRSNSPSRNVGIE